MKHKAQGMVEAPHQPPGQLWHPHTSAMSGDVLRCRCTDQKSQPCLEVGNRCLSAVFVVGRPKATATQSSITGGAHLDRGRAQHDALRCRKLMCGCPAAQSPPLFIAVTRTRFITNGH